MTFNRPARKLAATAAVALMLFAQFATAAHACEAIMGASAPHEAMAMSHGGSPCEPAAPAQDKLCLDHCAGAQSVDNHPGASVAPALVPVLAVAPAPAPVYLDSTQRYAH